MASAARKAASAATASPAVWRSTPSSKSACAEGVRLTTGHAGNGTGISGEWPVFRYASQRSMYSRMLLGIGVRAREM